MHLEFIAFLAGLISSTAAIPQIWTMIKTKNTNGVSGFMFGMKNCSCSLWVLFGVFSGTYSIILWNGISLLLGMTVVVMKVRISKNETTKSQAIVKPTNVVALPTIMAFEDYIEEPEMPKLPALRLVYSRPKEVQSSFQLDMSESASSPSPQA